jgi:chorismate mutase/prephenate dehydratase
VPDAKRQLDELRQEIAKLDLQLLSALDKRARTARRLGDLRKEHAPQLPLTDGASIQSLVARSNGDMPPEALREIFREIYSACLALELPVKIVYVGPEGGPGHAAAGGRFGHASNLAGAETTPGALDEVSRRRAEFAVVPFETSVEGSVHATIQALAASDLRVAEMLDASFEPHLMNRTGNPADVVKVCAAPADRALCEHSLARLAPRVTVAEVATPRMACALAAQEDGTAALADEAFGAHFGLQIAYRGVADNGGERVRYAVVGVRPSGRTGTDLTSLVFTVQEGPGTLLDVLKALAERGIDLRKIESHPARGEPWRYVFYAELSGHLTDRQLVTAFEELKRLTRSFKVLGSYPAT